jgi:hypothetical protein
MSYTAMSPKVDGFNMPTDGQMSYAFASGGRNGSLTLDEASLPPSPAVAARNMAVTSTESNNDVGEEGVAAPRAARMDNPKPPGTLMVPKFTS